MTEREPNIHDFPWLMDTGIVPDTKTLGAVMLPVKFPFQLLDRGYASGVIEKRDLHTSEDPSRFWVKGDVTPIAHVTLLYGLLVPAFKQADNINRLLADWQRPQWLPITGFDVFPSPYDDEPYSCIVARVVDRNGSLAHARGRLEYLPHVNTFPDWKLHATIAYVETAAADRWMQYLDGSVRTVAVDPTALDLGENK